MGFEIGILWICWGVGNSNNLILFFFVKSWCNLPTDIIEKNIYAFLMWPAFFHAQYYQTILDLLMISQELFSEIMISFFESVLAERAEGNGFADF